MSLASLGSAAATLDRWRERARVERRALFVEPKDDRYGAPLRPGLFTWDDENITFDFLVGVKPRRIVIPMKLAEARIDDDGRSFVPASIRREGSLLYWHATLSEYSGLAHNTYKTSLPERAGWNTVNDWLRPASAAGRGGYSDSPLPVLLHYRDAAERAYARVTNPDGTTALFLQPPKEEPGMYWAVLVNRRASYVSAPQWALLPSLTRAQREYVAVAYDQYLEEGKPTAPLQGFKRHRRRKKR